MKAGGADFNLQAFKQSLLAEEEKIRAPISTVAPTRALLATNRGEFPKKGKQRRGRRGFHQAGDNRAMSANPHHQDAGQQAASPGPGPSYGPPSHTATPPRGAAGPRYVRGRGYAPRYDGPPICYRCENVGHIGRNCPTYGDHVVQPSSGTTPETKMAVAMGPAPWTGATSYMVRRCTINQLVHADRLCILSPVSLMGYKYVISFVDDFSRFGVVYLTGTKSETFRCFQEFI